MLRVVVRGVIVGEFDDLVAKLLTAFGHGVGFDPCKIEVVFCPDDEERACPVDLEKPLKIRVATV